MLTRRFMYGLLVIAVCTAAFGQGAMRDPNLEAPNPSPNTYGTSSETVYSIGGWDFQPYDSGTTLAGDIDYRHITAGCCVEGPVHLPNGALITVMELEACDTNASALVGASLLRCPDGGGGCATVATVNTGSVATPGCGRFPVTVSPAYQVANNTEKYMVQMGTGTTAATKFGSVRIHYKLQVSPGPATATFGDVSNASGIYKFVEALAAAGITGGCGGGNYCPNDPVTRGQMAVFLSVALGLHFPN